jgi:nucleoid DNA-binding protein
MEVLVATKKKAPAKKAKTKKAAAKKPAAKKSVKKPAPKKAVAKKVTKKKAVKATKSVKAVVVAKAKRPLVVEPTKPVLVVPKNSKTHQYTQSELLDCMTQYCGFEKRKGTKEFYESFHKLIQCALRDGYKLMLPSLGKLQVKKRKARMGINPKTMESIKIPAKKKVTFTAAKVLKEAVL